MSKLGLSTGTTPNDGTGDSLLQGAIKINSNFNEIYSIFGNGTDLNTAWIPTAVGIHTLSNVGVGTTNPQYKLDISGTANISDNTRVLTELRVGNITNGTTSSASDAGLLLYGNNGTIISNTSSGGGGFYLRSFGTNKWYVDYQSNQFGTGNLQLGPNISTPNTTLYTSGNASFAGILTATDINFTGTLYQNGVIFTGGGGGDSYWVSTNAGIHTLSNVGVGTTNPQTTLQIDNVYGIDTESGSFTASPGVAHTGNSWTISITNFKTAEYTLWFQHSNGIHCQKALIINDGVNAYSQEYAIMNNNSPLVSVGATIESGTVKMLWTPESGVSGIMTYRFTRETML